MEKIFAGDAPAPDWEKLRPLLDEALNEMDERDRDAILLRYFDGRPFAAIGGRLRLTEGAARMRVERALAKLHAALARRGITSTAAALGVALGQQVGAAAPAGLAATVTGGALAASAASAGGWLATFMSMTKLQAVIAGGFVVAGTVGFISQATTNAGLRRETAAQRESQQAVAALRDENRRLASAAAEVEALRRDDAAYQRLAQRVAETAQEPAHVGAGSLEKADQATGVAEPWPDGRRTTRARTPSRPVETPQGSRVARGRAAPVRFHIRGSILPGRRARSPGRPSTPAARGRRPAAHRDTRPAPPTARPCAPIRRRGDRWRACFRPKGRAVRRPWAPPPS